MALKFHLKQWFNVRDVKRFVEDEGFLNFYSEQFRLQEVPKNTQVQTRMLMDSDNRIADQSTNEPRNEPEFTDDEFKWHYAKLRLCKAPDTDGIPTERTAHGGERLHNQLLKLFNECWMGKQNVP